MRENIGLFRGKRKKDGEWVIGHLYTSQNSRTNELTCYILIPNDISLCIGTMYDSAIEVIPETVGECTGLRDENGKLIFEHDVISSDVRTGYIIYGEGCWCVQSFITESHPAIDIIMHAFDVEILGNIHDNPEFLKEGADNG